MANNAFAKLKKLHLTLEDNHPREVLKKDAVMALCELLKKLSTTSKLKRLTLIIQGYKGLQNQCYKMLSDAIGTEQLNLEYLKLRFETGVTGTESEHQAFAEAISTKKFLRTLKIYFGSCWYDMALKKFKIVSKKCPKLKHLEIKFPVLSEPALNELYSEFAKRRNKIQHLNLSCIKHY